MEKNLHMTKPCYSEQSLPVPYVGYVGSTVDISLPNIESKPFNKLNYYHLVYRISILKDLDPIVTPIADNDT